MRLNQAWISPSNSCLGLTLIALAAGGCGGKVSPVSDESSFQENPGPAPDGGSSFKSVSATSPPDTIGAPGSLSVSAAGDAGETTSWAPPPAPGTCDDSYYRRVDLQVTNTGTRDVYLAVMGRGCTDYSIDAVGGDAVPLLVWGGVACDADPDWGYADTFERLPPGAAFEDNWFATRVVVDPSGCGSEECLVEPGGYRVSFGYELSPPAGCSNDDRSRPDLWYCPKRPGLPGNPVYASLCPTGGTVTKEFVLPPPHMTDAGDVTVVSVPLNAGQ
jgi:hypothetical protein